MKLIVAIVQDRDNEPISQALISAGFRVTRIASSGGWLRRGSTTLMIGVENEQLNEAIRLIRENCSPVEANGRRATLFVLDIANYIQI